MMTCVKYLLPISCVLLVGVSVWQLAAASLPVLNYVNYLIAAACVVLLGLVAVNLFRSTGRPTPTGMMPGAWGATGPTAFATPTAAKT